MIFLLKTLFFLTVTVILQILFAENALAWGPGVHMVTALASLNDAALLLPSIANIITAFPREYLYGSLAADFFIGKSMKKKERHPHNWNGGLRFLNEAGDDREAAYAYGFLSHLAADVIAHNFFIPNLIIAQPSKAGMGHLYWEMESDYLAGPEFTGIAKTILSMDHRECDAALNLLTGKRQYGLKTKKRLFMETVKFSDYLHSKRTSFFPNREYELKASSKYITFMIALSYRLVRDMLIHPGSTPCLYYDPMGIKNLALAKRKRFISRLFHARRHTQRFKVDPKFLEL